jgi:hypothetical protein
LAEIFRKSAKISAGRVSGRGEKGRKTAFSGVFFQEKCNFISLIISKITKKMQKNKKKCVGCDVCNGKILFLQSQTTTIWDGRREGLSTGNCSLKE